MVGWRRGGGGAGADGQVGVEEGGQQGVVGVRPRSGGRGQGDLRQLFEAAEVGV